MHTSNHNKCRRSVARGSSRFHLALQSVLVTGIFLIAAQGEALAQAISYTEDFTTLTFEDPATTADWNTTPPGALKLPTTTGSPVQSLNGAFSLATLSTVIDALDTVDTRAIAIGDLDGNGALDLIFGNRADPSGSVQNRVYFNDGFGTFVAGSTFPSPYSDGGNSRSAVIADFDADGFEDVAFAEFSSGQASYIMFNNGTGSPAPFTSGDLVELGDASLKANSIAAGDIDDDGDMDIVLGVNAGYVRVFRNNGFGEFVEATLNDAGAASAANFAVSAIALGDLDQDGDLDIMAARDRDDTRIYLNEGGGDFTDPIQGVTASGAVNTLNSPDTIALGDVDGDGDLDLLVGNDGSGFAGAAQPNRLYLNTGDPIAGLFPAVSQSFADMENTNAARFADVDRDGDLDLVTGGFASPSPNVAGPSRLYINDPVANTPNIFPSNGTAITADSAVSRNLQIADFDIDGKLDLVVAGVGTNTVVINDGALSGTNADQLFASALSMDVSGGNGISSRGMVLTTTDEADVFEDNPEVSLYVSDDGGVSWRSVHTGVSISLPSVAVPDFRWRAEFNSPSPAIRPEIEKLKVVANSTPFFDVASDVLAGATEDVAYTVDVRTRDFDDNDIVRIQVDPAGTLPAWLTLFDDGKGRIRLTGTPDAVDVGSNIVPLIVQDAAGSTSTVRNFTIEVTASADAPVVIAPTGDQVFPQGTMVNLDVSLAFFDDDGDVLTYADTGANLPVSLTLDTATGLITGTITNADVAGSPYAITITADDGNGGTVDDTFSITIGDVNDAPTFTSTPGTTADEGVAYSYAITTEDLDGDVVTITSGALPGWLTLTDNGDGTGTLGGTPAAADAGMVNVTLTVDDGVVTTDQAFTITVTAAPPPPPPPPPPKKKKGGGAMGLGEMLGLLLLIALAGRRQRATKR